MNSYIDDLYNGRIYPAEQVRTMTDEYHAALTGMAKLQEFLENQLNPSMITVFENFLDEQNRCFSIELQESYTSGFKLGANLMIEILLHTSDG